MKFGPSRRVRKRPEFQEIQRKGKRVTTTHFIWVLARSTNDAAPSRLGVTASKRVGNAVRRNRLKRIVRAAFRQEQGMVPCGYDVVVICRADSPELSTETVVQQWRAAHSRVQKALAKLSSG